MGGYCPNSTSVMTPLTTTESASALPLKSYCPRRSPTVTALEQSLSAWGTAALQCHQYSAHFIGSSTSAQCTYMTASNSNSWITTYSMMVCGEQKLEWKLQSWFKAIIFSFCILRIIHIIMILHDPVYFPKSKINFTSLP